MKRNFSIRSKLIAGILIGCLFPFFAGVLYTEAQIEKWIYNNNIEKTSILLNQTAKNVDDAVLLPIQKMTLMLSQHPVITSKSNKLNSYIDYEAGKTIAQTESEKEIYKVFKEAMDNYETITFISYGTEDGGYVEYPVFTPDFSYDPRVRDWYKNAAKSDSVIVSEPYMTLFSEDFVVSVDKAVYDESGKLQGVLSVTITLEEIMNEISRASFSNKGFISVLSPNDIFINNPANTDWHMKSVSEVGLDMYENVEKHDESSFTATIEGTDKVVTVYISPYSGWKYIYTVDKSKIIEESKMLSVILNTIIVIASIVMIIFILTISNHFIKPIANLAVIIRKLSTFRHNLDDFPEISLYIKKEDEIGEISRALKLLQDNYDELYFKMCEIENEINSINIGEKSVDQISLSSDNIFFSITRSINSLLIKVNDYIQKDKIQIDKINYLALHDPLTNLPNRRSFDERLLSEMVSGAKGAVLMMDMDNFKSINDSLGHVFGDKVLKCVAEKITSVSGENIFISRFGGDEFMILYKCEDCENNLEEYLNIIFDMFNEKIVIDEKEISVEFSMGISLFPQDSQNIEQLIMNADLALYSVKGKGKNSFAYFNERMAFELKNKINLNKILIDALENDGFKMVYQPQIDLKSGEINGFEALIRLKKEDIPPSIFISAAEENGFIINIGRLVTRKVIMQMNEWKEKGYSEKAVSINFSGAQIKDKGYNDYIFNLTKEYSINPQNIIIEITEHIYIENQSETFEFISDLRDRGFKIAIDDFGMGYSSLSYLATLPVDFLKFDRALNHSFLDYRDESAMKNLIAFVHSLELMVVAEGIEKPEHVEKLKVADCDSIQGFCFSKPLEVEEIEKIYYKTYR